jgi:type III secretion protein C
MRLVGPSAALGLSFVAAVLLAIAVEPRAACAGAPDWSSKPYEYLIVDQDLRTVIGEFGKNVGVRTAISAEVQGRVRGSLPRSSASVFLESLSRSYGLDWYFDGATLFISATSEAQTRILELHEQTFEGVAAGLARAGLSDARYGFRPGPTAATAIVSGPPRFVELVMASVSVLTPKRAEKPAEATVRVYRGALAVERVTFPAVPKD